MLRNLKPLGDRVLLKRLDVESKTAGGIYIPDTAKEKAQTAEVIAVGAGRLMDDGKRVTPAVKAGDIVVIGKYAGTEFGAEVAGDAFVIVREDEILGVVEK
jgi:chaperonin GroES